MGTDNPPEREDYAWVEFVEVQDNRRLPLPEEVQDALQNDLLDTPCINWGYDESSGWMVLSKTELKKDGYTNLGTTDIDRPNYTTSYIRPKKKILEDFPDQLSDAFTRTGAKFVYIATEQMIDDNPSSWLVEQEKLLQMLPEY
jgi:hypothetical protein